MDFEREFIHNGANLKVHRRSGVHLRQVKVCRERAQQVLDQEGQGDDHLVRGRAHGRGDGQVSSLPVPTALLPSGRLFTFGSNEWGQLGLGHNNNVIKPSCVKVSLLNNFVLHVLAGERK
jgi:hypothetical protein